MSRQVVSGWFQIDFQLSLNLPLSSLFFFSNYVAMTVKEYISNK